MIGRKTDKSSKAQDQQDPQGFDDYHVSLGDLMRGERATLGKSLLDVQRELRIKASYISAVENCDPSAFDTPGFIAGYVRSYARYLGMDPDDAFRQFCAESGFTTAHGMSDQASSIRKPEDTFAPRPKARDPLADPKLPFAPQGSSPFASVEPGAIGSTLVLLALIGGIGYGGWFVLQEVQRVQLAPVDQTPMVLSELDPLERAMTPSATAERQTAEGTTGGSGVYTPPTSEAFDRLYRPQALDVPVVVARDAPISTLDPASVGVFAGATRSDLPRIREDSQLAAAALRSGQTGNGDTRAQPGFPQGGVTLVAARPSWVRIRDAGGNVLHSGILDAGDTVPVPAGADDPRVELGEAGAIYFAVNGNTLGPAGPRGDSAEDVPLDPSLLAALYPRADFESDSDLRRVVAELSQPRQPQAPGPQLAGNTQDGDRPSPQVLAESAPGVTIVATRDSWVRVKSASGATVYEAIMNAGDTYSVPRTEQAPTIRTGDAGAIYFAVGGQTYGPYGGNGAIADNLALAPERVVQEFAQADVSRNEVLARTVAELESRSSATTFD